MKKTIPSKLLLCLTLVCALCLCSGCSVTDSADINTDETHIQLSDEEILVDGEPIGEDASAAVYVGADIIYYEDGQDETYGEGTEADAHSAAEADAHTVVTIREAGIYRLSGNLSAGQIFVDLGEEAAEDPSALVTLILDGVDIQCTVAPAIFFYNVYECGSSEMETASATVDTGAAGANVILADGSVNTVAGAYVARIYEPGTTDKLHKYDGAFYSRMSMNIDGETLDDGELHLSATNEGLGSELHLTINGGRIYIESNDDGINTNEDFVSVTTINGGYLHINAGLGMEGDGIDSNGYLVINGGTVISLANGKSGDGGLDADSEILINGGEVIALGSRNDAVAEDSQQVFMELSYASTQTGGTLIRLEDAEGNAILTFSPLKDYQSFTYSSPALALDTPYSLYAGGAMSDVEATDGLYPVGGSYSGGILQQYTGNAMGGMGNGQPPAIPDESQIPELPEDFDPENAPQDQPEKPDGERPAAFNPETGRDDLPPGTDGEVDSGEPIIGSSEFIITETVHSFSGISDSPEASQKQTVTFSINNGAGITNAASGETLTLSAIQAVLSPDGEAVEIPATDIQITITDVPSENYAEICMLSDGEEALAEILPTEDGTYQLTISVLTGNSEYTGTSQWQFSIGAQ